MPLAAFDEVTSPDPDGPDEPPPPEPTRREVALVTDVRTGRDALDDDPGRPVALDVTHLSGVDAVSEESLGLAVGVRLVRTTDVRRTRRVVEVMAHLLAARRRSDAA